MPTADLGALTSFDAALCGGVLVSCTATTALNGPVGAVLSSTSSGTPKPPAVVASLAMSRKPRSFAAQMPRNSAQWNNQVLARLPLPLMGVTAASAGLKTAEALGLRSHCCKPVVTSSNSRCSALLAGQTLSAQANLPALSRATATSQAAASLSDCDKSAEGTVPTGETGIAVPVAGPGTGGAAVGLILARGSSSAGGNVSLRFKASP